MFLLNGVFGMMSLLWANLIKITEGLTGLTCVETKSSVPNLAPRCRLKWCWCRKWHQSRECPSFYFLRELGSERCKSVWSVSFVFGAFGNRKASTKGMCLLSQLRAFYLLGALGFSNAFLMPNLAWNASHSWTVQKVLRWHLVKSLLPVAMWIVSKSWFARFCWMTRWVHIIARQAALSFTHFRASCHYPLCPQHCCQVDTQFWHTNVLKDAKLQETLSVLSIYSLWVTVGSSFKVEFRRTQIKFGSCWSFTVCRSLLAQALKSNSDELK